MDCTGNVVWSVEDHIHSIQDGFKHKLRDHQQVRGQKCPNFAGSKVGVVRSMWGLSCPKWGSQN